ncbi:hypothetical protein FOA43_004090 [Brettanomyces nanus]|uniref:FAD dependent oxidoreductase domain-containing protein n=1 Tax=Eeniella nana TaxID=13502 RepID=A0A875S5U7_EENNA|nr:uncharacterized protein FOA43_004090 [Brettanomyces nanus]QPG76696.1 hypothetical protein FOA43_004090 [Brettanomyces nanus]
MIKSKFYSDLAMESLGKWKSDPIYKTAFHETGIIYGGSSKETIKSAIDRYETLKKEGYTDLQLLDTEKKFIEIIKDTGMDSLSLKESQRFKGWKGFYQKKNCGWTYAALALQNACRECKRLGAKFIIDSVEELNFNHDGNCTGVLTFSGQTIFAERVVITAGANSYKFLDYKGQLLAKCWTVGHIKLKKEELEALKGCPVVLNLDKGFFFEPDEFGDLKFCNEFPGYINLKNHKMSEGKISVPVYKDKIPKEAETLMRDFLSDVLPSIANRKFNVAKICWCTDSPDRHFLICEHPDHKGLILGTGDSGQGFKYMPIIGKYIAAVTRKGNEGLCEEKREAWRWRPETAANRDIYALQERAGGSNKIKDLKDVGSWTNGSE